MVIRFKCHVRNKVDDKQTRHMIAIVNSMTLQERQFPDVIRGSRKRRIASGSGTDIQAVNRMLKQFTQMQKMMKKFGKGGMGKMMKKMGQLQGSMPPGGFGRWVARRWVIQAAGEISWKPEYWPQVA